MIYQNSLIAKDLNSSKISSSDPT